VIRGVGFKTLASASHRGNRSFEIGVQAEPDSSVDGCAQPARFGHVGPSGWQAEDIGGKLHSGVAHRAAAGHTDLVNRGVRALADAISAFEQSVG